MHTPLDALCLMDGELETQITEIHSRWNSGHYLRLFTDNREPTPEDLYETFTEPTLTGYGFVDTSDEWTTPARDEAGVWSMQTEIYTFTATDELEEAQLVYGGFIEEAGVVKAAGTFETPFSWDSEHPLRVRVIYSQFAAPVFELLISE